MIHPTGITGIRASVALAVADRYGHPGDSLRLPGAMNDRTGIILAGVRIKKWAGKWSRSVCRSVVSILGARAESGDLGRGAIDRIAIRALTDRTGARSRVTVNPHEEGERGHRG